MHLVLRNTLADVVPSGAMRESRPGDGLRLFPYRKKDDGTPEEPTQPEIDMDRQSARECLLRDPAAERCRLVDALQWLKTLPTCQP